MAIKDHLTMDAPNPARAPYLPATVILRQYAKRNPIQLKMNATDNKEKRKKIVSATTPGKANLYIIHLY